LKQARCWTFLLSLLLIAAVPLRAGDDTIEPGIDAWSTPSNGQTFHDFSGAPIPEDFFGPGSDPFDGRVNFFGEPLPNLGPPGSPSIFPADTVVERLEPATLPLPGSAATVPIQIVAMNLGSANAIQVSYNGGQEPELWDVKACLSETLPQPVGEMTCTRQCPATGGFAGRCATVLPVRPKLVFIRELDGAVRTLDPAPEIVLTFVGARWVGEADALLDLVRVEAGALTDGDCDGVPDPPLPGTSDFAAGVRDLSCDTACNEVPPLPQKKVLTEQGAPFAGHSVAPAGRPAGDFDLDGVPDDVDNCIDGFNPFQEDLDGDGVGDLCDNCPTVYNPCQEDTDGDFTGDACEDLNFADGFESGDLQAWSLATESRRIGGGSAAD